MAMKERKSRLALNPNSDSTPPPHSCKYPGCLRTYKDDNISFVGGTSSSLNHKASLYICLNFRLQIS